MTRSTNRLVIASLLCFFLSIFNARALTYTAATSGNFSAVTTWSGGIAPIALLATDIIVIPSGITVTLNNNLTISSSQNLTVNGTLTSGANMTTLILTGGSLTGAGSITVDSMVLGMTSGLTYTGSITAQNATSTGASIATAANMTVNGTLHLNSGSLSLSAGSLTMGTGSTINVNGGSMSTSGVGMLNLSNAYNVSYTASSVTTGAELSGTGLTNVMLNTPGTVSLGSNTTVNGTISLTNGTLSLNNKNLTFGTNGNLSASGSGMLSGTALSSITVNATNGLTGSLKFTSGNNTLQNLTVNTGSTSSVSLGTDVMIAGTLTLSNGMLALNNNNLTFTTAGNLSASGSGSLSATPTSSITVNATNGLTGSLNFSGSNNTLQNLTINTGSTSSVSLGSDIMVAGTLTLSNGTLALNNNDLTFTTAGNLSASGSGSLSVTPTSSIIVNSTNGLTGSLNFSGTNNTLQNLTINTGSNSSVSLGTDVMIAGTLTLSNGVLSLNNNDLTFTTAGNLSASGSGSLSSTANSGIIVNSTNGLSGSLNFSGSNNTLQNLTINTGSTSSVSLGTDVMIAGTLTLSNGTLALNNNDLTFTTAGNLSASGSGSLSVTPMSSIIVNATNGLTGSLNFSGSNNTLQNLTINTGSNSSVALGSDLMIAGTLMLDNGMLMLGNNDLTFTTSGDLSASGAGSLSVTPMSSIVVNSTNGLTGTLDFASGNNTLQNLTINTGSTSNVSLGSDVMIAGTLMLDNGMLSLNNNDLTFTTTGDLAASGAGSLSVTPTSNITINATDGLTGSLNFASGNNTVNNLAINLGSSTSNVTLGSDLSVAGELGLQTGKINLGSSDLMLMSSAMVTGGSSSSYVVTNGTGKLISNIAAGVTDTFQVGTAINYAPMIITAASGSASGDVAISVIDTVYANGTNGAILSNTQPLVGATWFVTSTATTGINYDMTAMWDASMEVNGFNRTEAYISHYTSGAWDVNAPASASVVGSMYAMTRTGITSLSPFTVADKDAAMTTGINEINNPKDLVSVYPNPAKSQLSINSVQMFDHVNIYDVTGKLIVRQDIKNNTVDVANLISGLYMAQFTGKENATGYAKFSKE